MTPRAERRTRMAISTFALALLLGSLALGGFSLLYPLQPRPLPQVERSAEKKLSGMTAPELDAFARKRISRAIVKQAPPPPPKPVLPPLDSLVRLSGIMDYGPESAREAFIEARSNSQTKSYRVGDVLAASGAQVKAITDGVVLEYDGKLWKLTDRGAVALPGEPVSGKKP